jgi:hypothetical protein
MADGLGGVGVGLGLAGTGVGVGLDGGALGVGEAAVGSRYRIITIPLPPV